MMRRLIVCLLAVFLLTGCARDVPAQTEETTTVPETTVPEITVAEEMGLYDPDSEIEVSTNGAVRAYPLDTDMCNGVAVMGDDLLMFMGEETGTRLVLLTGENLCEEISVELDCYLYAGAPGLQINERGIGYYDDRTNEMVFLNTYLQETSRLMLPENITEIPLLSSDWNTVYYCDGDALRALDLNTGIPRLVREEINAGWHAMQGLYWDDQILACWSQNDQVVYLSVENGQVLYTGNDVYNLHTDGGWYFAQVWDESVTENIFSSSQDTAYVLNLQEEYASPYPALEMDAVVAVSPTDEGDVLDYYDLNSGKRTASVLLEDLTDVGTLTPDPENGWLWFIRYDLAEATQTLYRWEPDLSAVVDDSNYVQGYFTQDNPDAAGLAECQTRADAMGEAYGVDISVWEQADDVMPIDYFVEIEYKTAAINNALDALESTLKRYPEGFLQQAASLTDSGKIHIGIVRSLYGDQQQGALSETHGIQYWVGSDAYIMLSAKGNVAQMFNHEVFHVIDSYVLSNSKLYYDWDDLNPWDFDYDYDYLTNLDRDGSAYLEIGNEWFIDTYSMSYPKEDRARIMEYAMMSDCEHYFQSEQMQRKLRQLSKGIRDAFDMKDYPQALPWEQYLKEPLI